MTKGKRLCFALDLKDEQTAIEQYVHWHKKENVWPEITASIKAAGIEEMEIYLIENRLMMIMEVSASFNMEKKAQSDASSEIVQQWEKLMSQFQVPLWSAKSGEKWVAMNNIYKLEQE